MDLDEWVTSSNDCFFINLTRPSADGAEPQRILDEPFNPAFTYPIFDEAESIVGYKDPKIELDFRANDMRPALKVGFEAKLDLKGVLEDGKQVDLATVFHEDLPTVFQSAEQKPIPASDPTSNSWKPPGEQLHSFELHGKQYEIWKTSLADPAAKQIWDNMQILPLLFVEGASRLDLDADWLRERWSLYLLYEVTPLADVNVSPYTMAGFCTAHRYWIFPTSDILRSINSLPSPPLSADGEAARYTPPRLTQDTETYLIKERQDPMEAPSRDRISQFIILPPYQGQSLGARLYETIFGHLVKQQNVFEIAVEDPNEDFDAMRDYSDIVYLRKLPEFQSLTVASTLSPEKLKKSEPIPRDDILGNGTDLDALRHKAKIVTRQFNRMLELHALSTIPHAHRKRARTTRKEKASNENDRRYYFWRLALKARVYRQNYDVLDQMEDSSEKVEALEKAVDGQQDEYEERLKGIEKRAKWSKGEVMSNGEGSTSRTKRKRNVVLDDEEEEWEDMDEDDSAASSKKMKV